jgi:hypothetical protein
VAPAIDRATDEPARSSTLMCFDAAASDIANGSASSPTVISGRQPADMSRRACARAWKTESIAA